MRCLGRPGDGFRQFFFDEKGDRDPTSPENANALSRDLITFVEGAGDRLHTQRYVFNVRLDYSDPVNQPVRWLAEGRGRR